MNTRILLIDDDTRMCSLLQTYMSGHGFTVTAANNAQDGLRLLRADDFQLVLLDIMLPDADGLEVCKKIRAISPVPIVMLTARGADEDKIIGLELGADDYVAKPFNPRELVARAKAVIRRGASTEWDSDSLVVRYEDFYLSGADQKVQVYGQPVELTTVEFKILKVLASNPGRVFTRERLLNLVQGREFDGIDRSIDVHISRLRTKIEKDPRNPRWIKTVWGAGYRFQN